MSRTTLTQQVIWLAAAIVLLSGVSTLSSTRWLSPHWDTVRSAWTSASDDSTWDASTQTWRSDTGNMHWDAARQMWATQNGALWDESRGAWIDAHGDVWDAQYGIWIDPTGTYFWNAATGVWEAIYVPLQ